MLFNAKIEELSASLRLTMTDKNIWNAACPVTLDDLRLITLMHYDFDYQIQIGDIIVNASIAHNCTEIFKELFGIKFPIKQIKTIDHYDGDDIASMEDNNSSCFNFRPILNSNIISMHSYGLAVDINPSQNPYIIKDTKANTEKIYPEVGINYLDRTNIRAGMVENITQIFAKHGLNDWGGKWKSLLDYHHFQIRRENLKYYILRE